jgi:hypothetical protein
MLSDEKIQKLTTESVSYDGNYGSLEKPNIIACGKPGKRPRVPADSMEAATDSVAAHAKQALSTG